ncbi:glycosyltransferase [Paenibacillus gansuensis]|uniref:Glycosyltransferase n=1 Tax=Paenibacillus gansuensis TaxID=306542 RepID=A0ABW5PGU2_9BACL
MSHTAVSIIVPMFKVEAYLHRCVDSLLGQTLDRIEVILVNDGSPDRCGAIADEYAAADPRVRVLHQPNRGVSSARNAGMRAAAGDYIGFVDPDDWIEPEMFSKLYEAAADADADAAVCAFHEHYEEQGRAVQVRYDTLPSWNGGYGQVRRNIMYRLLTGELHSFTWNKLYRRSLLIECGVKSPEDMPLMQDIVFNLEAFSHMDGVVYIDEPLYHFRRHASSNTMKFRPDVFDTLLKLFRIKHHYMNRLHLINSRRLPVYEWFVRQSLQAVQMEFSPLNPLPASERKERVARIAGNQELQNAMDLADSRFSGFQSLMIQSLRTRNFRLIGTVARIHHRYRKIGSGVKRALLPDKHRPAVHG